MRRQEQFGDFFVRGNIVDKELFGEVREKEYKKQWGQREYLTYEEALAAVKVCQPFHPEDPKPQFAKNLREEIMRLCGGNQSETEDHIFRFYTAVGDTHADFYHKVDGFMEWHRKRKNSSESEVRRVTFDIKTYDGTVTADVRILVPPEGYDLNDMEEQRLFMEKVRETAVEAMRIFKQQQWKTEHRQRTPRQKWQRTTSIDILD